MRDLVAAVLLVLVVMGCGASTPSAPPSGPVVTTPEAAGAAATRLATIAGPLTVGEIKHGTYADLWRGSTNDLTGEGTADGAAKARLMVWRVELTGPNGAQEVYIDETTGELLDAITQGS